MCDDPVYRSLQRSLCLLKDSIGRRPDAWDDYKLSCNPYEAVYSSSPPLVACGAGGAKAPASRAFYKLWELVHDEPRLLSLVGDGSADLRVAYLAEAPGSFVEAVVSLRGGSRRPGDRHWGITLQSPRRSVPLWRLPRAWMREHGVQLSRGGDGTGDITAPANIEGLVGDCGGEGSCGLVTADGGIDFSSDFNGQEHQIFAVLAAECLAASRLLRPGGHCVLKVFDAFDAETLGLLAAFAGQFSGYSVAKPRTSRPANSERYMVCLGFAGRSEGLARACAALLSGEPPGAFAGLSDEAGRRLLRDRMVPHVVRQVESILGTLDAMDSRRKPGLDLAPDWLRRYVRP